jgi:hypothetical protein
MLFADLQSGTSGDLALLVHVAGAMILVGGLLTAAVAGLLGWRDASGGLLRISYWTLFAAALPGWIVMRVGAEWIYSNEGWDTAKTATGSDPSWISIGQMTADAGGALLLVSLILGGVGIRKMRAGGGEGLIRASSVIATVLVAVYVVAVWAMGGKPT